MTDQKRVKPAIPHKPSPKNVVTRGLPTDGVVPPGDLDHVEGNLRNRGDFERELADRVSNRGLRFDAFQNALAEYCVGPVSNQHLGSDIDVAVAP